MSAVLDFSRAANDAATQIREWSAFDTPSDAALAKELASLNRELDRIDIGRSLSATRDQVLSSLPSGIRRALTHEYLDNANYIDRVLADPNHEGPFRYALRVDAWREADRILQKRGVQVRAAKVHLASSDSDIRDMARRCAEVCTFVARGRSNETAYAALTAVTMRHAINAPRFGVRGISIRGCIRRMCEEKWWRRAIRSTYARTTENLERELGLVSKYTGLYASDDAVKRRRQQKVRNRNLLQEMLAVNDLGESIRLSEASDANVSNPKIRRAELMLRNRGFEELASSQNDEGIFVTVTTPSRFHARYEKSGQRNRKFDGSTVRQSQNYLCKRWSQLRAAAGRRDLDIYGFRIAEPHHDGTVHWHLILFVQREKQELLQGLFRAYFDPPEEQERGSAQARVEIVRIDPSKGSATGYVAKYVSKNIDGHGVGEDSESEGNATNARDTCARVDAWASTHGIRQFQQIGGPPVSVWREARRIKTPVVGAIERVRQAVENKDWKEFCEVMGYARVSTRAAHVSADATAGAAPAITRESDTFPARVARVRAGANQPCADAERRRKSRKARALVELFTGRSKNPGTYGDHVERQIKGLRAGDVIVPTRTRSWFFVRAPKSDSSPWTCVNNCTRQANHFNSAPCIL